MEQASFNPLAKHFRQPAVYLKLPSAGRFWSPGSIEMSITEELPILPLTSKDEITLRTPDALLNGQGVVDVIQSCCPSIKNAWEMPSVDVDAILIAIRIASYGQDMDIAPVCPHCATEHSLALDLTNVLDKVKCPEYNNKLVFDEYKIKLKPQKYEKVNFVNKIKFEEQQLIMLLNNEELSDENKSKVFAEQLSKIIDLNAEVLVNSTEYVEIIEDSNIVSNPEFIDEFYRNCPRNVVDAVKDELARLSLEATIPPITHSCDECKKSFEIPITFDYANFFALGS